MLQFCKFFLPCSILIYFFSAYGQTGSGKTYTMLGPDMGKKNVEFRGIIPRSIEYMFSLLRNEASTVCLKSIYRYYILLLEIRVFQVLYQVFIP